VRSQNPLLLAGANRPDDRWRIGTALVRMGQKQLVRQPAAVQSPCKKMTLMNSYRKMMIRDCE
jgi:hypothetical protein